MTRIDGTVCRGTEVVLIKKLVFILFLLQNS